MKYPIFFDPRNTLRLFCLQDKLNFLISLYRIFLLQIIINGLLILFNFNDLKRISKKILFGSPWTIKIGLEFTYFCI